MKYTIPEIEALLAGTTEEHPHEHSIFTRCLECQMFGVNLPGDPECGNCGAEATVQYRPPCCFAASKTIVKDLLALVVAHHDVGTVGNFSDWGKKCRVCLKEKA